MDKPPKSFDDWLRQERPRLLRLALSRTRDRAEAEDAVQETALAVWRQWTAGKVEDLDAYARRAVWQNSIKRRSRRRDWTPLEDAEVEGVWTQAQADDWIEAEAMEEAIAELPAAQQAVLRLRFYTGLSFRETADALAISLNTAASRCRYALETLRHSFDPLMEESHEQPAGNQRPKPKPSRIPRRPGGRGGRD